MEVLEVLHKQLKETREEQRTHAKARIYELTILWPACEEFMPPSKHYDNVGIRALAEALGCPTTPYHELVELFDSCADLDVKELDKFCIQAEVTAGINLSTETWEEFEEATQACAQCLQCSMAASLISLSTIVLGKPLNDDLAGDLGHGDPKIFAGLYDTFVERLTTLIPNE